MNQEHMDQIDHIEDRAELNGLIAVRRDKLRDLMDQGIDPFGERFERTHTAQEIVERFAELEGEDTAIAGRIMSLRTHGKATFADLMDQTGRIQLYFRIDVLGEEMYGSVQKVDIGDILGITGKIFRTRKGEISVEIHTMKFLSKSLLLAAVQMARP